MDANKQGGRVRSLFGLLLPSADRRPPILGASLLLPGTARAKAVAVVVLIGIASPFLG